MQHEIEVLENMPSFVPFRRRMNAWSVKGGSHLDSGNQSRSYNSNSHKDHPEHNVSKVRNARRQIRALMGKD